MKACKLFFLLFVLAGCQKPAVKPAGDSIRDGFQDPPLSYRPHAFLSIHGDTSAITAGRLTNIKRTGMGGVYLLCRDIFPAAEKSSCSDSPAKTKTFLNNMARTVRQADNLDIEIGLVAAGSARHPENGAMGFFTTTRSVRGPAELKIALPPPVPDIKAAQENNGAGNIPLMVKDIAVLAFPAPAGPIIPDTTHIFNLTPNLSHDTLSWQVPRGEWQICRHVCANTGEKIQIPGQGTAGPAINTFNSTTLLNQLEIFLETIQTQIDSLPAAGIKYLFCPAPPTTCKTWTPGLLAEFQKRRGYALLPFLPVLNDYTVLGNRVSDRFKYDFLKTLAEINRENYRRTRRKIAAAYGLQLLSKDHCVKAVKRSETAGYHHNTLPYTFFQNHWHGFLPFACNAYKIETGAPLNAHLAAPHPAGIIARSWFDFTSRCAFLLQQGHLVADLLFYTGESAANFYPYDDYLQWQKNGYHCDMCATDDILFKLDVSNGDIVRPDGGTSKILVLPGHADITPLALEKIHQLVLAGATVVGPKPETVPGLSFGRHGQRRLQNMVDRMWRNITDGTVRMKNYGRGWIVCSRSPHDAFVLRGFERDFFFTSLHDNADIVFIHRRTDSRDIYFVANKKTRHELLNCHFHTGKSHPQLWDPETGSISDQAIYRKTKTGIKMPLRLKPRCGIFVVFENRPREHILSVRKDNLPVFPYHEHGILIDEQPDAVWKNKSIQMRIWTPGEYSLVTTGNLAQLFYVHNIPPSIQLDPKWEMSGKEREKNQKIAPQNHKNGKMPGFSSSTSPEIIQCHDHFIIPPDIDLVDFCAFLRLDHIPFPGRVLLNGAQVGVVINYSLDLDITKHLKPGANYIIVEYTRIRPRHFAAQTDQKVNGPSKHIYAGTNFPGTASIHFARRLNLPFYHSQE